MKWFFFLITIHYFVLLSLPSVAQQADNATADCTAALSVYHSLLKPETGLYKGNEYTDYRNTIQDGSPLFGLYPFDTGSVVYHGILYRNMPIAYDIILDEAVIYDASRLHKISLIKNEVSWFTSSGSSFIHLTKDSAGAASMKSGFYQVLYGGNTRMLKKEALTIQERTTVRATLDRYIAGTAGYFIQKNGVYHPVNNKAGFLSVMKDKEKEMQAFIRKKRLKFRKNKDVDFAQAAAYYDAITQ